MNLGKHLEQHAILKTPKITYDASGNPTGIKPPGGNSLTSFIVKSVKDFGAVGDGVTDDYTAIMAAVSAVEDVGGGIVFFPQTSGVYKFSDSIVINSSNIYLLLDNDLWLSKTNPTPSSTQNAIRFEGRVNSSDFIDNVGVVGIRKVKIDCNGRNVVGYNYEYSNHNGISFKFVRNYLCKNIWCYNGLVNGISPAYCLKGLIEDCDASDTVYDNGIYLAGNGEQIVTFDPNNPATWHMGTVKNCKTWNCKNHGQGIYGAVGCTFINPKIWDCGNNDGVGPAGPAGGFGIEYDGGTASPLVPNNIKDHHLQVINLDVRNSYGFALRMNANGVIIRGGILQNTKYPTAYSTVESTGAKSATGGNWSSGVATITVPSHGWTTGQVVDLRLWSPVGWNGTYTITVVDANTFTIPIASNPGSLLQSGKVSPLTAISGLSWSSGLVTVTSNAHGRAVGDLVNIVGASPAAYNGTYTITSVTTNTYTYRISSNPGTATVNGYFQLGSLYPDWGNAVYIQNGMRRAEIDIQVDGAERCGVRIGGSSGAQYSITAATYSNGLVTYTTSAPHGISVGHTVNIAGVGVSNQVIINGNQDIYSVPANNQFTIKAQSDPGTITLTSATATLIYMPSVQLRGQIRNTKWQGVLGLGVQNLIIDPSTVFENCVTGLSTIDGSLKGTGINRVVEVFNPSGFNTQQGYVSAAGKFLNNLSGALTCVGVGYVDLTKGISGEDNAIGWDSANHACYVDTCKLLQAANINLGITLNSINLQSRILTANGITKAIIDRASILGDQSNTSRPKADVTFTSTFIGDIIGSTTYDPPSVAANSWGATTTVTVTGAAIGDAVRVVHSTSAGGGLLWQGVVSSSNTVTCAPYNPTGASIDTASGTLTAIVTKIYG